MCPAVEAGLLVEVEMVDVDGPMVVGADGVVVEGEVKGKWA